MLHGHELIPKNSSSAAINTLPNTIIYSKAVKYFIIQARRTLFKTGTASVASKKTELGVWGAL